MSLIDDFTQYSKDQLGKPYVLGAHGPDSYDCSGLIYDAVEKIFGKEIPRMSTDQYVLGRTIAKSDIQRGDVIFFDTGWTDRKPNHNGIVVESGKFINANSYNGKVVEDSIGSTYWRGCYYGTKRFFDAYGDALSDGELIFSDVPDAHPDYEFIMELKDSGVIRGDGGASSGTTTFRPDSPLNRAESLKMILKCFSIPLASDDGLQDFLDVPKSAWYFLFVKTGVKVRIVSGYGDGSFRPANPVTRAEASKMILEANGTEVPTPSSSPFSDVAMNDWAAKYVLKAHELGMLKAYGKKLRPHNPISRGNLCRALVKCNTGS